MMSPVATTGAAVVLACMSVVLLVPAPVQVPERGTRVRSELPRALVPLAVLTAALVLWSWLSIHRFVLVALAGCVVFGVARLVVRRRAVRAADRRCDQVLVVCDAVASDLAAGQPPLLSLDSAAVEWSDFAPVAVAGRMGADIPTALRELATRPGAGQLRTLAATWQVAHDTGTGLADAIGQAAAGIRSDRRTERLVAAELAAAYATARMLAVLPVGVLLLGSGIGGDPIGFLTGTTPGLVCLALGIGLSFGGLLWLDRIAGRVLRR